MSEIIADEIITGLKRVLDVYAAYPTVNNQLVGAQQFVAELTGQNAELNTEIIRLRHLNSTAYEKFEDEPWFAEGGVLSDQLDSAAHFIRKQRDTIELRQKRILDLENEVKDTQDTPQSVGQLDMVRKLLYTNFQGYDKAKDIPTNLTVLLLQVAQLRSDVVQKNNEISHLQGDIALKLLDVGMSQKLLQEAKDVISQKSARITQLKANGEESVHQKSAQITQLTADNEALKLNLANVVSMSKSKTERITHLLGQNEAYRNKEIIQAGNIRNMQDEIHQLLTREPVKTAHAQNWQTYVGFVSTTFPKSLKGQ